MADGGLESLVEAAAVAGPQLRAAQELARALPHLVAYLGPGGAERLDALPPDDRERVTGQVRQYLEIHPELLAMLETPHIGGSEHPEAAGFPGQAQNS